MLLVRSLQFTNDIWEKVAPIYKQSLYKALGGGIKITSDTTYTDNFIEYWRTCRRLGIPDILVWTFPICDAVIQIYIIDCIMVRKRINVWSTMKLKLRSIDYVVQLTGIHQSWSDNPAFKSLVKYAKKTNPGQGSDTLPVTAALLRQIVQYILDHKVYNDLILNDHQKVLRDQWRCFKAIWKNKKRWFWYLLAISFLIVGILGLRGCECYENPKVVYNGYGLWLSDLTFYWKKGNNCLKLIINNKEFAPHNLHHIRFRLRNTKTGQKGKPVYLRMGRTFKETDPAIILYKLYCVQKFTLQRKYKYSTRNRFLFAHPSRNTKLNTIKKRWKDIITSLGFFEGHRYRFHGTRKGFAGTLSRKGVAMSRISYAGRWKLQAAIYSYLIHTQKDLLDLCLIFLYGNIVTRTCVDMDQSEIDLIRNMDSSATNERHSIDSDYLARFDASLEAADIVWSVLE